MEGGGGAAELQKKEKKGEFAAGLDFLLRGG